MTLKAKLVIEGPLGILRIDNPPVNSLSPKAVGDMITAFAEFEANKSLQALVIECAGRTFVAGGDIASFVEPDFSAKPYNSLLAQIENCSRPVVAALFGTVLGGGLELALACHHRIATSGTKLGLPEINLGLLPGSLGTQRLPRLAGIGIAYQMISTGKPLSADAALKAGIVDEIATDFALAARLAAKNIAKSDLPLRRTREQIIPDISKAADVLGQARAAAAAQPYLPAKAALVKCLDAAVSSPFPKGEAVEAAEFMRLLDTPVSHALRHIFFAERAATHIPHLPHGLQSRPIASAGIVGVGTMGAGIAINFANAGVPVRLVETTPEGLERGLKLIRDTYAATVKRGLITEDVAQQRLALLTGSTDFSALSGCDIIVEAVFEDMALKLSVAQQLGKVCKPGAIIATNTSTLDVDKIANATGRPGDVVGTHFFSPAHIMKLLEIVRGAKTEPDVLVTVMKLAKSIRKTAVVSGVCYGFIGNRMAEVYGRENEALQLEGATPKQIDAVAQSPEFIGMAMGPSRMLDMAGVDVGAKTVIEWIKSGDGPQDPAYRILCRTLFEKGQHGQKTAHGYYRYEAKDLVESPETKALCVALASKHGVSRRDDIPDQEIFERLLFPMVNEAARILEEGIAYRPGDIDVVWTAGYGFPAWRGGPIFMADEIGLARIVERMDHYANAQGNAHGYWTVSPLLRQLAAAALRLSDWSA
jgi:3-hydroxyacyl-CoA dehydrogenase